MNDPRTSTPGAPTATRSPSWPTSSRWRNPPEARTSATSAREVLYEIKVDNTGDAKPDVTYEFRFDTTTADSDLFGESFLFNDFPARDHRRPRPAADPDLHGQAHGRLDPAGGDGHGPADEHRPALDPDYAAIRERDRRAQQRRTRVRRTTRRCLLRRPGVDLRSRRPAALNSAHLITLADEAGVDGVGGYNTHTISIQVPITDLTGTSAVPEFGRARTPYRHLGYGEPQADDCPARRDCHELGKLGAGLEAPATRSSTR